MYRLACKCLPPVLVCAIDARASFRLNWGLAAGFAMVTATVHCTSSSNGGCRACSSGPQTGVDEQFKMKCPFVAVTIAAQQRIEGLWPAPAVVSPWPCKAFCVKGAPTVLNTAYGYPVGLIGMLRRRATANYWAIWTLEMPLYLEDIEAWPERYRFALPLIAALVRAQPVNPAMAIELIRTLLGPLLPESQAALLDLDGQPTWQRIHFLYPKLMFESRQREDADPVSVATLVRHTTRPAPRAGVSSVR